MSMLMTITLEEAQATLTTLVHQLALGQEIIITENQQPVARPVSEFPQKKQRPTPGQGRGSILYMAPDFDAPL
ncbi:MAG: hypothetical protein QG599_2714 [Pseudomonadota bacterium]|nr:hypothetical protein [Pseudomonadota bacterium]